MEKGQDGFVLPHFNDLLITSPLTSAFIIVSVQINVKTDEKTQIFRISAR